MNKESFIDELRLATQQAQCWIQKELEEEQHKNNEEKEAREVEEREKANEIIEKTDQNAKKVAFEGGSGVTVCGVPDEEINNKSYNRLGSDWEEYHSADLLGVTKKVAEHYEKEGFKTFLYCDYMIFYNAPSFLNPPITLEISWLKKK